MLLVLKSYGFFAVREIGIQEAEVSPSAQFQELLYNISTFDPQYNSLWDWTWTQVNRFLPNLERDGLTGDRHIRAESPLRKSSTSKAVSPTRVSASEVLNESETKADDNVALVEPTNGTIEESPSTNPPTSPGKSLSL